MKKDPAVYIRHIHDCILRTEGYVEDGRAAFFNDHKTQDAVIRNMDVIGQAVRETLNKLISLMVRQAHHERNQQLAVRPEPVEGLVQCFLKDLGTERLSAEQPAVPWTQIAGARNVLAHQYLGVALNLVWNIIEQNLPSLKAAIHETADRLAVDLPDRSAPN